MSVQQQSVQQQIESKLRAALSPVELDVANESHMHSVPAGSESHFRVVVVTDAFDGQRAVARHQRIYQLLSAELAGGVHALALHTYTPAEWQQRAAEAPASPACLGGSKHDKH